MPIYRRPFASSCSISIASKFLPASAAIAGDDRQTGFDSGPTRPYLLGMLRKRIRELDIPLWARNRALHYLANEKLSDDLRHRLTQVVHGYIGRCDEDAARAGIDWMRERYRAGGRRRVSSIEHKSA
jgi:hypothetical protein